MAAKITLDQAKKTCDAWAVVASRIRAADAAFEERVKALTAEHERALAADRATADTLERSLLAYCKNNKEELAVPVRTVHGVFGLRASTILTVDGDQESAILAHLREHQFADCIKPPVDEAIIKTAIKNRLERGETIPHCTLTTRHQAYIDITDVLKSSH